MSLHSEGTPDAVAFEQLVEEYGDRVYGIALRITGSPADAEDAMQDAFLSAFRSWAGFRAEASPTTWLYRIAVNAALQRVRSRRPIEYLSPEDEAEYVPDWSVDLVRAAGQSELYAELERGIGLLPPDVRVAVVLRDVEGLSTSEAAAAMEMTEAAVKSRLHRGRALLRRFLQDYLAEG
ncbi:MAG: sigma-70 family RNA polymerase sigma factor [Actinobacteria bacterium]|nr:sigma-70 family RNA polymerase sigma factor [Actinomycetota bacterium]